MSRRNACRPQRVVAGRMAIEAYQHVFHLDTRFAGRRIVLNPRYAARLVIRRLGIPDNAGHVGFARLGFVARLEDQSTGSMVSENFFSVLRVQPLLGRTFTKDEDQRGGRRVVLLGEDFWKRHFATDRNIVGQNLTLEGHDYTVIGIVPRSIRLQQINNTFQNDVFTPIGQYEGFEFYSHGTGNGTLGLGRLKPGVTLPQARAEMDTIMRNLGAAYPNEVGPTSADLVLFREDVVGNLQPSLLELAAAVGFVLLIACTNVANLALARSTNRTDEFGI